MDDGSSAIRLGGMLTYEMAPPVDVGLTIGRARYEEGPLLAVRDPWTGDELARVVMADAVRAEEATLACVRAFERTRAMKSYERRDVLRGVAKVIRERADEIARLIAREAGKPITQAKGEVARAVSTFDIASEEASRMKGEVIPLDQTPVAAPYVGEWVYSPAGPVLGVAPFNFPLNLVAHKVAPALACGCSILLKPPPQAPLTSLLLAAIVREAGAPEDALLVVPCANDVAETMVRDDRFATLSFTGSAKVGWMLKGIAGKKRVLLELGGNAAAIVHEDADRAWALERIVSGAFAYAGQVCIKVQRLYVHRPIAEAFIGDLVARARAIAPANPLEEATLLGPMIDEANAKRVEAWVEEARAAGGEVLCGGTREGSRYAPTVIGFRGDGRGTKVVDEEIFGPVLTVHTYETWDDALKMADATRYGLQAGIFTDSHARIREAFTRLHVGGLIVNDAPTFRVDSMPYGGTRDSGLGREGVRFAMEEMMERKLLVVRERG
jgi:acyl-CoA reductase-like NAD-dependent aldehyde dehydrogenase